MIIIFILKFIFSLSLNYFIFSFSQNVQKYLRVRLFEHYQNLDYQDYVKKNTGDIIYTVTTLTSQFISGVLTSFLQISSEIVVVSLILFFLFFQIGAPLLFVSLIFFILIFIYDFIFKKLSNNYGIISNKTGSEVNKIVTEAMYGFKEIKFLNKSIYFKDNLISNCNQFAKNNLLQQLIINSPRHFIEIVAIIILLLYLLIDYLYLNETDMIVNIGVLCFASLRMLPSLNRISGGISKIRYNYNTINKLYDELTSLSSEKIKLDYKEKFTSLRLENISFSYPKKEQLFTIDDFKLNQGDFICITGESGSGKSSFIDLLLGLNIPTGGNIYFNEKKIDKKILPSLWNDQICYITQTPLLIDASILKNITLSAGDYIHENLHDAIMKSSLHGFIDSLPHGYDTIIGDRGVTLSGGQRQRIALARALYHDRDILILDESTNSLDDKTEEKLLDVIHSLKGIKTIIMIAHNSRVIKYFYNVYNIANKRLSQVQTKL